jgi:pimeloyl-ACP methyl ester carboxylesterase
MNRRRWGCGCAALALVAAAGSAIVGVAAVVVGVPVGLVGSAALRERADPRVAAPPGRFVDGGDVALFVLERGPADGPAALFVHGSGAWSGTWEPTLDALAARGVRAIAVDLPPFGYSERPPTGDYSRPAQARRLLAAADAVGVDSFVLVGHSFGGGPTVDAAVAAHDAGRLDGLALISAALGVDAPASSLGPLAWGPARTVAVASTFTLPAFTPVGLRHFVHDDAVVTPEVIARYRRPLDVRGTTDAIAAWLPELAAPSPSPSLSPATYEALDAPVLLLWGAEDTATPVAQAEALAGWLPDAELRVLDGVGHLPHVEAPAAVHDALSAFVSERD